MKLNKIIISIVLAFVLISVVYASILYFRKDESKTAQTVNTDKNNSEEIKANKIVEIAKIPETNILANKVTNKDTVPAKVLSKEIVNIKENEIIKMGEFIQIDAAHKASGQVTVAKDDDNYKLKFSDNFNSVSGPDLYIYLSSEQDFKNTVIGGVDTSKTLNIGKLKNLSGSQEYVVTSKDYENHNAAIIIWCKQFGVQFSRAELN